MDLTEMIKATPIQAERTTRRDEIRALTSAKAGKIIPLAYAPLLREDRVSRGQMRMRFEMAETVETLMNGINVTCYAHFVPFLAFERFEGSLDRLNRAYKGVPDKEGGDVVPFFSTVAGDWLNNSAIVSSLGVHVPVGTEQYNASVLEAYNALVNFRTRARSGKLPQRNIHDRGLAPAFWKNTAFNDVVPDFDQARIDGEVELQFAGNADVISNLAFENTDGSLSPSQGVFPAQISDENGNYYSWQSIQADLQSSGVKLSLANIDLAKRTAAFAELRRKYDGIDDDALIDMLMEGIRIPDQQMAQPVLLDRQSTVIGYSKRYATNSDGLDKHVTTGETVVDLRFRTPPMNTGGIILITAEIVPEQLFERQKDHFLYTTSTEDLPNFTRDYLDPEKVRIVKNDEVDVLHSEPDGTFGYAPLNSQWKRSRANIGGKFMRQPTDPFDEDRQRIWAVETLDPTLTEDFYLVNNLHHKVFLDQNEDPFEITTIGQMDIVGHTVFGKTLEEDSDDYDKLSQQVDNSRIDQGE